ncbi:MAG: SDR family oxidoreductase [Chloroflexi bacterium]|nr:SDR family oxidoreductase [Chloroflexota bacterium]
MSDSQPLLGKTALVTGASRNLGAVTALTLAQQGASVVVHYQNSEVNAQEVADAAAGYGVSAYIVKADLANGQEVRAMIEKTLDQLGKPIDILVNNAGPFNGDPFSTLTEAEWDRVLNINLKAVYLATQLVASGMRANGWGRIINVSAGSAYIRNHGIYGLAKSALITLTEALALELGPEITVNAVAPGQIAESGPDISVIDPTFVGRAIAHSPGGRLATRQEVANIIAWLCSPLADMITGETIPIDAGWRFNRF